MLTADTILIAKLNRVFFYTDATGVQVVGPTRIMAGGTNIGQDNPPSRGIGEVVGTYTGKSQQNSKGEVLLEVNWTNSFYKSKANLFTPGSRVTEARTSWVKESQVEYTSEVPQTTTVPSGSSPTTATPGNTNTSVGNTLLGTPSSTLATNPSQTNNNMVWIIVGGAVLVVAAMLIYFRQPAKSRRR